MARTVYHSHIPGAKQERGTSSYEWYYSLCGDGSVMVDPDPEGVETATRKATCPACAKKWGAAELAKIADRLTITPLTTDELPYRYRSGASVAVDGVVRGFVVSGKGFGKGWTIFGVARRPDPQMNKALGGRVGGLASSYEGTKGKSSDGSPIWNHHRAARDAAITAFPALVEGGFLPTVAEQIEKDEEAKRAREQAEADRTARNQQFVRDQEQKHKNRIEAKATIESLRSRAIKLGLTNEDLSGLFAMEELLKG